MNWLIVINFQTLFLPKIYILKYSVDLVKHLEYILHLYSFLVENHANILKRSKHFKILQEFYQKLSL